MLSILITNAYSARNRGDAAIVLGMLADFAGNRRLNDARVTVSTQDFPADTRGYPCPVVPSFHSLKDRLGLHPTLNCLAFLILLLPVALLWAVVYRLSRRNLPLGGQLGSLMRSYTAADIVVAVGGGYLCTTSRHKGLVVLFIHLLSFWIATFLGKPVYLYSQSIGPFAHPLHTRMVRTVLRTVRLVQLREDFSLRLVESWGLQTPLHRSVDAAFLVECAPHNMGLKETRPRVGVTVRTWFRDGREQRAYEATMTAFLRWLVEERRVSLFFLPQVTVPEAGDDDRPVARRVMRDLPRTRFVEDMPAAQLKAFCGEMDLVMATRLHSAIFATTMFVPCLTIGYQPKAFGIMEELGLSAFVLPIERLNISNLQERFDLLSRRAPEIRSELMSRVPKLCDQARLNSRIIAEDYERWSG